MEMLENILSHVLSKIPNFTFNFFEIKVDETTDVQNRVYVRYIYDKHLESVFCFVNFQHQNNCNRNIQQYLKEYGLKWKHVNGVFNDGTPATISCHSGFQTLIKKNLHV